MEQKSVYSGDEYIYTIHNIMELIQADELKMEIIFRISIKL